MYREFTLWAPLTLIIMVISMIAIGAYYGSGALEALAYVAMLALLTLGMLLVVLLIINRNVLHHTHRTYHARDAAEGIGVALSQANITEETFHLPEDMTIVCRLEDNVVLLGPVREDNQAVVDGLKRLVDQALD